MAKLVESIPNFSVARDREKFEKILSAFRAKEGVKLLDYSSDDIHNRSVVTLLGEPEPLKAAIVEAVAIAKAEIDMREHRGQHPRMGAVDVIPFVPIKNISMEECIAFSKEVASEMHKRCAVPVYLYQQSATNNQRAELANLRRGQFEKMAEKTLEEEWRPDYGEQAHPTYGITAVGARKPLIAFNVYLDSDNLTIAQNIARSIRASNGGLAEVKAIAIDFEERGQVQVSMNLCDYQTTPIYRVVELIKVEAKRYGVNVLSSELIGLTPVDALIDSAEYYLQLENFSYQQVLEKHLLE